MVAKGTAQQWVHQRTVVVKQLLMALVFLQRCKASHLSTLSDAGHVS
jgi:hypothetical protein